MESHIIEGNNVLEVYTKLKSIVEDMRINPRPVLSEFKTFRMRGHEEASGTKYVPSELIEMWEERDPLVNFENYLLAEGILTEEKIKEFKDEFKQEIDENLEIAFAEPVIEFSETNELNDVYKEFNYQEVKENSEKENIRLIDAISQGLKQSMERHDNLVIMGQDVAEYDCVSKITEGFVEQFGNGRVRNTPICESAIVSTGMGLSINGFKAVVEMQFADFVSSGFNPDRKS